MSPLHRRALVLGSALILSLSLAGCGGGEERQEKYLTRAQEHLAAGNYDKARVDVKNVLQINPNNAEAYFLMAEVEEQEQNWQFVLGNLNKAIELDPANLEANIKLGHIYLLANNLEKAREQADKAAALAPEDPAVLGLQAVVEFREGDKAKAQTIALKAIELDPGEVMALRVLVELYQEDKPEEALALVQKGRAADAESVPLRLLNIRVLEAMGRDDEVIAEFQQLVELYPDSVVYVGRLVDFYVANDRLDDAEKLLRAQVKAQPDQNQMKMLLVRFMLMNKGAEVAVAELEQMLQQDPENAELRAALGGQLAFMGETERAEAVYKATFDFDTSGPSSQAARNQLTQLALSRKDFEQAARWNDEALEIEPENPEALANRARLKMVEGDYGQAIPDLRMALRGSPDSVTIMLLLAEAQQKNRSIDLALDNYRAVLRQQPGNLIALYQSATILAGQENYAEAEANIEKILAQQPENVMAINLLTEILSRQQRWDDAQMLVDRLAANEKTAPLGDTMTARLELRQGNLDTAIELAEAALAQNDKITAATTIAAQAYAAKGDTEGAIKYLETYLAKYPDSGDLYDVLAQLYLNEKQTDQAVAAYKRAIEYAPERIQSYVNLARILQFRGTPEEIVGVYEAGIASNPESVLLKLELSNRYQLMGDYDQARKLLEEGLAIDANSPAVKNNLAGLLIDFFPSEENMRRAQELTFGFEQSGSPPLIDTLGWLQYKQGNIPQSVNLLVAAQKAGGEGPDYWYHLGMAYYKNGQLELAKEQLGKALSAEGRGFAGKEEAQKVYDSL